jgi:Protein of unknown function (DUF3240)
MTPPDCLLTLDVPRTLEDEVVDALRAWPQWQGRIHRVHSESLGQTVPLGRALEKMRGCALRTQFSLALAQADVAPLIDALRQRMPAPDLHWWATPVLASGTLA